MKKLDKQNGITLIALIITIIVMLILVGVTINVALNGGLFNNANDAKTKTQKAVSKEELIATMIGAYDNTGNFDKSLIGTLPSGAKWCREEDETYEGTPGNIEPTGTGDWIITKENNKFYIDENGSVLDEKPEVEENNPWIADGLTSSNVVYDKPYIHYSGSTSMMDDDDTCIILYSNGGMYTGWDEQLYTSVEMEELRGMLILSNNLLIIPAEGQGDDGFGFVFNDDDTLDIYQDSSIVDANTLNTFLSSNQSDETYKTEQTQN